ncbi:unnamed protein product [Cylindrotheca closterium]|uniref:DUF221-domain-containing protein n=1 Tax=Cylindrotheca closterium TaxID=2856 RepID=A0AAD2FPT0_9STRA|nr:unnamed protein product [Cylindrotheca closterium]
MEYGVRSLDSYYDDSYGNYTNSSFTNNTTDKTPDDDITSQYIAPSDVSVDAVLISLYWNAIAFVIIMASYECLRRLLPAVYSSQIKRQFKLGGMPKDDDEDEDEFTAVDEVSSPPRRHRGVRSSSGASMASHRPLPDIVSPYWVTSVFAVSWNTVRKYSGLDGYFFLRYIRMNLRICAVTAFWAIVILVPVYSTGKIQNGESGWYHFSMANVAKDSWRMWIPSCFAYLFTGFIFFVIKQEYRHFLELRMDFLARGSSHVIKQHHYSLLVENIPYELRSEAALFEYFNGLFPGKVHSASVILNLKDLETVKAKTTRVCRRLEKSIAHYHAEGNRPTHIVGSPRINILGVDLAPFDWTCGSYPNVAYVDNRTLNERPAKGTHVDSISYYVHDLAFCNMQMDFMSKRKVEIALSGNKTTDATNWVAKLMISAYEVADQILVESAEDNALKANHTTNVEEEGGILQAELMSSFARYGSFGPPGVSTRGSMLLKSGDLEEEKPGMTKIRVNDSFTLLPDKGSSPSNESRSTFPPDTFEPYVLQDMSKSSSLAQSYDDVPTKFTRVNSFRRLAGRLGLDFVVSGLKFANSQLDQTNVGVVRSTMSSTGFVTLLDLTSVTTAATTPLTSKPGTLAVNVAPEPRDIIWENVNITKKSRDRRERVVNVLLVLGLFFWIIPLTLIQLFATVEYIAKIPGMEWIAREEDVSRFVKGYLPVVALLCLILILPVIFKFIALNYERRMTYSDVQKSMLGRYFYYQLFNIYITVTAGSLGKSLYEIINHPSEFLELLGEKFPTMVGYFIALLVTKVLAGLPIVFVRIGALSRMLLQRALSSNQKLTQRELDEIYRPENVQYGWEYPSQLLVIVIVFTYAVISPIILPVGVLFFAGSLVVYKKQVLYVYQPVYESGGAFFPAALQRSLFGLVCGQLTLIGYFLTRGFRNSALFLLPLPLFTIWGMRYCDNHFADPSKRLSLERAREYDRVSDMRAKSRYNRDDEMGSGNEVRRTQFNKDCYRQPVLTQKALVPKAYRRGQTDPLTFDCCQKLKELQQYSLMEDGEVVEQTE